MSQGSAPRSGPRLALAGRKPGDALAAVLVLAGASAAELRRALALAADLSGRRLIVAVDGGLRTCRRAGQRPDLFVGDGDSSAGVPGPRPPAVWYPVEKEHSDFAGALDVARRRGARVVCVAGLLGGRLDHEWANLLELAAGARGFAAAVAATGRGTVVVTREGCRAALRRGQTFSLFNLGAPATVTLRGARYELRRATIRPGSRGLSNVARGAVELTVHRGVAVLVVPAAAAG